MNMKHLTALPAGVMLAVAGCEKDGQDRSFPAFPRSIVRRDAEAIKSFIAFPIYRGPMLPAVTETNFVECFDTVKSHYSFADASRLCEKE